MVQNKYYINSKQAICIKLIITITFIKLITITCVKLITKQLFQVTHPNLLLHISQHIITNPTLSLLNISDINFEHKHNDNDERLIKGQYNHTWTHIEHQTCWRYGNISTSMKGFQESSASTTTNGFLITIHKHIDDGMRISIWGGYN